MKLTTITPYWGRPEMLKGWVKALRGACHQEVNHLVYFIGEYPPDWWEPEISGLSIWPVRCAESPGYSIGHYHNLGARRAETEWIMKLDVDCIPHAGYFSALLRVLNTAKDREWFNGGMLMLSRADSMRLTLPLSSNDYFRYANLPRAHTTASGWFPQGTNFICRTQDYLQLGGCDERFQGYGWEDYQQIYMLERFQTGADPLPGVTLDNVTRRCREEISRRKAAELYAKDSGLCLLHRFHPPEGPQNGAQMESNRNVLFSYIQAVVKALGDPRCSIARPILI